MKTLNITKGEATVIDDGVMIIVRVGYTDVCSIYPGGYPSREKALINTQLIADAFNTANKTGLLPSELNAQLERGANQYAKVVADYSELAEQNERLKKALIAAKKTINNSYLNPLDASMVYDEVELIDLVLIEVNSNHSEPATLTRSEAEEAMNRGEAVTFDGAGYNLFKKNGLLVAKPWNGGNIRAGRTIFEVAPETGWRIANPNNQ